MAEMSEAPPSAAREEYVPSRRDSISSDSSGHLADATETLLGSRKPTLSLGLPGDSSMSLEQFFRVCADTLANQRTGRPSRATTFGFEKPRRAATLDFEPASPVQQAQEQQRPALDAVFPGRSQSSKEVEALHLEQSFEWNNKRTEWRPVLDSIEDVWRSYFPDCGHGKDCGFKPSPANRCHPLTNRKLRKQAQRELVLARLCLEHGSSNVQDSSGFLPWLSVIGYKLQQIHTFSTAFSETFRRPHRVSVEAVVACNLLTCALRYFYEGPSHYLAKHNEFCIGWMLEFCYKREALPRPESDDDPVLEDNFRHLIHALWCLNIIQTPRYHLTFTYNWNEVQQRLPVMGTYSLDLRPKTAVEKSFEEIERRLQDPQPKLPEAVGENVRCGDLNIQALRNIGGLKIVWTTCDRDHLFLDQESGVLRVSWFNRVLVPEFFKYMPMLGRNDVYRTWEMLLGHRKQQHDFTELERIALPSELSAFNKLSRKRRLFRKSDDRPGTLQHDPRSIPDIVDKYESLPNLPRSVPYAYFGRYETRVRNLRHYMDARRPTGFKNLWHDRRDTLSYYTFWAVMIFGGLSVVLAFLGLAAAVVQAWAAIKAVP